MIAILARAALAGALLANFPALPARAQTPDPFRHVEALQAIAEANGGNRAAGTSGYDASADYVAERLRAAGYQVRMEEFTFPFARELEPPRLVLAEGEATPRGELRSLGNSGSGEAQGRLVAVDLALEGEGPLPASTSGCEAEDFLGFPAGAVALLRRGTCPFQQKVDFAAKAGAAAAVIMNEGTAPDRADAFGGQLSSVAPFPVLAVSIGEGRRLARAAQDGASVEVAVSIERGARSTRNVLAEREVGNPERAVVVGAHLDSVREGPGINDNGSGTAAVLEAALQLAAEPKASGPRLRFAFWGAEELGLIGSRHHVNALSEEERRRVALYVNLDMVGSPNPGRFVQGRAEPAEGIAAAARERLLSYFRERGLGVEERLRQGRLRGFGSDDASFADRGIPTVGLYTGAGEAKPEDKAAVFGGEGGRPYDPCYHRACDTPQNIDRPVLGQMTEALLHLLRGLPAAP